MACTPRRLGDAGSTIAFCHGLFGQGKNWTQIAKALSADHRVLLLDMPNHGRSPWTETFDYVELADLVAEELRGARPVTLVGHSMGGKIAMCVALRHPELVERLVRRRRRAGGLPERARVRRLHRDHARRSTSTPLERRDQAEEALRDGGAPPGRAQLPPAEPAPRPTDGWHWQLNLDLLGESMDGLTGWPDERLGEASYDGPVLWVGGADSDYIADEHSAEMDRRFPRNRRVLVKGAGHWVHSEQPEIFLEVLRRFLA